MLTRAATDMAKQWDGWGTALKPAHQPIVLARKPLAGSVAANVQRFGTGGLNIDACRIATGEPLGRAKGGWLKDGYVGGTSPQWNSIGTRLRRDAGPQTCF